MDPGAVSAIAAHRLPLSRHSSSAAGRVTPVMVFGVAGVYYALAFLGVASDADAAVFLLLAALLVARLRPFLLVLAATVQDAPGQAYFWSYVAFAGVAGLMLAQSALDRAQQFRTRAFSSIERLMLLGVMLVTYGICVAWAQDSLGGYRQSTDRWFVLVGGLVIVNMLSGYYARLRVDLAGHRRLLGGLAILALVHALAIGLLQVPFGQEIYRSGSKFAEVEQTRQLVEAGAIGFARINGPFLSPNTFGYSMLLLAMISLVTLFDQSRWRTAWVYVLSGAAAVLLSMSKAVLGYYGLSCLLLCSYLIGRARTVALALAALIALPLVVSDELIEFVFAVFRVQEGTLGTREWAWTAAVQHLQPVDWVSGIGVGAWPVFFERQIGLPLQDPHALLLSLPGSYGLPGVVFFLALVWMLFRADIPASEQARRLGRAMLLVMVLVKDLASIPSVLGNTPVTFLVWLLLGLVLCGPITEPDQLRAPTAAREPPGS